MEHSTLLSIIITVVYVIAVIYTNIRIITDTTNSAKSLAYILLTIFVPVVGMALYFSIGINYRKRKLYHQKLIEDQNLYNAIRERIVNETEHQLSKNAELIDGKDKVVRMLLEDTMAPLIPAKEVKLLINGEQKFEEVFKVLESAKDHIHIQYYIFGDDVVGNRVKELLIRKAEEGVKVRFIFDDFGSHSLHKKMLKELKNSKVELAIFYEIRLYALANRMNYRNHRKIIVVDGHTGFVGGINVEDKYINDGRSPLFWRDTHIMTHGAAVAKLQYTFINDWNFCSPNNKITLDTRYFSAEMDDDCTHLVQIATSGPDSTRPSIMLSCLGIIMSSKKRLYITSPYFIPNDTIVEAITYAALSGVDVRMLVPGKSDSKLVNAASCSYYGGLLKAGVRIYRYQKGFVHAKTMVSDDTLSVVGSANMDMRSFDLNFEINALIFSRETNAQLCAAFMNDINDSIELHSAEWEQRSKLHKLGDSLAHLISPLL